MAMMASVEVAEFADMLAALTAAWRAGDRVGVRAFMADDPHVAMGGPGSALPGAIGPAAVAAMIDMLVNPLPEGAGVFPGAVKGYAIGDLGWLNCDAQLRLPGQAPRGWFITMVVKREDGQWRFLNFGAFAGA
ncbi:nuclear transport factor 2 family protein [Novosphingobium sp. BL-52-GroH]|uniref:nuclear transport factor 2 family protein n=1 Tax=Novosphingobium sp. BL-52-GroH TaxID=3349877 RepID=UPI00384EA47F